MHQETAACTMSENSKSLNRHQTKASPFKVVTRIWMGWPCGSIECVVNFPPSWRNMSFVISYVSPSPRLVRNYFEWVLCRVPFRTRALHASASSQKIPRIWSQSHWIVPLSHSSGVNHKSYLSTGAGPLHSMWQEVCAGYIRPAVFFVL